MSDFFRTISLKTRILSLMAMLLVAGIWGLAARTAVVLQGDIEKLLSEQMSATVAYVATDIDSKIQERIDALNDIAQSITPALLADPARLNNHLRRHFSSRAIFPVGIFVINKEATVIADSPVIKGRIGGSIKDRDFVFAAMTTGRPTIGGPVIGRFAKKPLFTLAVPLRDGSGKSAGALLGSLYPSDPTLFGRLEETKIGKTVSFLVISPKDHLIVSATDKSRIMQPLPAKGVNPLLDQRVEQGFEGAGVTTSSLGVENLTVSRTMKTTGWVVLAAVPTEEAFALIVTLKRQIYLAALLMTLVMIAVLRVALARQLAPLDKAGAAMRRMTEGAEPLAPLPVLREDEIGRLVGNFNQLATERLRLDELLRTEIAERQSAEATLRANEEMMRSTFEHAAVGIAHIAPDTYRILAANDRFCNLLGYARDELVGSDSRVLTPADEMPARESERAQVIAGRIKTSSSERRLIRKDGASLWVNRSLSLVRDAAGQPKYFISVIEDISARKQAEEVRAFLAAIVNSSYDAIVSRDLADKILSWNSGAEYLFGYTADEAIGQSISMIFPPDRADEIARNRVLLAQGRAILDLETVRLAKGGRRIDVSLSQSTINDERGVAVGVALVFRDIGERVRKTALMRLLESLARATNEAATPEIAMQACIERICAHGNWPLGHVAMYLPGQSSGMAPSSFWRCEDNVRFGEFIRYSDKFNYNVRNGQFVGIAIRERRPVWVEDMTGAQSAGRFREAEKFGIRSGFVFPVFVGGEVAGFLEFFATETRAPDLDLLAAINSIASQLARLMERGRAADELAQLNAQLEMRVADRTIELETANKELNSFSYTIAHDMRAPVRAINGFSELVLKANEGKLDQTSVAHLKRIVAGSRHMGELIDDLLNLARLSRQEMRRRNFNLSELAASVVASLAEPYPECKVAITLQPDMNANGDPGLLRAALDNLIGNALKYTAKTISPGIEIGAERRDGRTVYYVRDNGVGFDMQYAHKLFSPFQRLHHASEFEGTGIGLATVKKIIQRHGGEVWIESAVNLGTTVSFTLGQPN